MLKKILLQIFIFIAGFFVLSPTIFAAELESSCSSHVAFDGAVPFPRIMTTDDSSKTQVTFTLKKAWNLINWGVSDEYYKGRQFKLQLYKQDANGNLVRAIDQVVLVTVGTDEKATFVINKSDFPEVFESATTNTDDRERVLVLESITGDTQVNCQLWNYKAFPNVNYCGLVNSNGQCVATGEGGSLTYEPGTFASCSQDRSKCCKTHDPAKNCTGPNEPAPSVPQPTKILCSSEIITDKTNKTCGCTAAPSKGSFVPVATGFCCGWTHDNKCFATQDDYNIATAVNGAPKEEPPVGGGDETDSTGNKSPEIDIFAGPTSANFKSLNPLEMFGNAEGKKLSSPGAIVSRILVFAFPLAGLILFVMIVWGGFEMLSSAASKGIEAGKQRVTAAIIGFMLLFTAYWIFQIVEVIFGVAIL